MPPEPGSLIRTFKILGLHGYKDVEIEFAGRARIVIAENGSGKTTILSALQAFLDCEFERLDRIHFEAIECQFAAATVPVTLTKAMLTQELDPDVTKRLTDLARFGESDAQTLARHIRETARHSDTDVREDSLLSDIYMRSPLGWEEFFAEITELREVLTKAQSDDLRGLALHVRQSIRPIEILYLPTYRRVELPLARPPRRPRFATYRTRELAQVRYGVHQERKPMWDKFGIQFGLADVEHRLSELFGEIQRESNMGYREISANIIDDLLKGEWEITGSPQPNLPTFEALERFFSRIEAIVSPTRSESKSIENRRMAAVKNLYATGEIESSRNRILRYFLTKLSRVVEQTREVESNIEKFVEKANVYLQQSSEEKRLQYDATRMKVVVQNLWTEQLIKLDDLSSGEKQVISVLAHLYLYDRRKIVLIDEPELSLSIDWQKRFLPDVLESPTCVQLLAITHSPFIFDNALDPFAGPLRIRRRGSKAS